MPRRLRLTKFRDLDISDPFFDSLKEGYDEFPDWFARKADENVYVVENDDHILSGFIYLKLEDEEVADVDPPLPAARRIKVGTLKIEGRGTRLGERVLKKIFDHALAESANEIYVTVFDVHANLIALFEKYGFRHHGTKTTDNGVEQVYVRSLVENSGDIERDYPFLHTRGKRYWLLAIYPDYHTKLFPDSILRGEHPDIVEDVTHTNTVDKNYIARLPLTRMSRGDIVAIYRTTDRPGLAKFRSVVTSICVVKEVRRKSDFPNADAFVDYALPHSVFDDAELRGFWVNWGRLYVLKMTYNAALTRRLIRQELLDEVGITVQPRWDLRELSRSQLIEIVQRGNVNARLVVD